MNLKKIRHLLEQAIKKSKELTLLAGRGEKKDDFNFLHQEALELTMNLKELENTVNIAGDGIYRDDERVSSGGGRRGRSRIKNPMFDATNPDVIEKEIVKVSRRLPNWMKNQDQMNARILTTYLRITKQKKADYIMEKELAEQFSAESKFRLNYNTMKAISKNNNGKVFDVREKKIYIWEPARQAVEAYRRGVNL